MNNYSVSKVQQSNTYPIYQLWMYDDSNKVSEDDKFKICVLTVLEWLRDKVRDANDLIPEELNYPSSNEYSLVNINDIHSCTYHRGYEIDTISLIEDRIFVASFSETDNATEMDKDGIGYDHYAGRKVKTEYAIKLINHRLEIGIRVLFSDGIGIDAYSTPKRPSIVKRLIENSNLSFKQTTPVTKEIFSLKNSDLIDLLKSNLSSEECGLNAVVLIEKDYTINKPPSMDPRFLTPKPSFDTPKMSSDTKKKMMEASEKKPAAFQQRIDVKPIIKETTTKPSSDALNPFIKTERDIRLPIKQYKDIVKSGYGYAVFYELKLNMIEEFNRRFSITAKAGECVILEPDNFGGKTIIKKNNEVEQIRGSFYDSSFGREIRDFNRKKEGYYFGNIEFTEKVRALYRDKLSDLNKQIKSSDASHIEYIESLKDTHEDEKNNLVSRINKLRESLEERDEKISILQDQVKELEKTIEENKDKSLKQFEEERYLKEYWRDERKERPTDTSGINEWVKKKFNGKLILHDKAVSLLEKVKSGDINFEILLDALEFLAVEYREHELLGTMDDATFERRCYEKYGSPFEIAPNSDKTLKLEKINSDYKVRYGGKEMALELHLKYGTHAPDMIRIYFSIIKEEDHLILVGSLPNHLPTFTKFS